MAEDSRRLFSSAFNATAAGAKNLGGSNRLPSMWDEQPHQQHPQPPQQPHHHNQQQQQPNRTGNFDDPLRDLQKLLNRLLASSDAAAKEARGVDRTATGAGSRFQEEATLRPVHQHHHQRHHQLQQHQQQQHWDGRAEREAGRFDPGGEVKVRHHLRTDRQGQRVKSAGAAWDPTMEHQYAFSGGKLGNIGCGDRVDNYDHWFTEKSQWPTAVDVGRPRSRRHQPAVGQNSSTDVADVDSRRRETQIPVIDRRPRKDRQQRPATAVAGRVPPSPSWPVTCRQQQEQDSSDGDLLWPRGPEEGRQQCRDSRQSRETAGSWWQTMPSHGTKATAGAAASTRQQQQLQKAAVSSRREATLRASAEQLDHQSRRDEVAAVVSAAASHRRTASDTAGSSSRVGRRADRWGEGGGWGDYEAMGSDQGNSVDDEDDWWASEADAAKSLWYRPSISREQAVAALRDAPAGSFLVRDSQTYPGCFGMAVRVDRSPPSAAGAGVGRRGDPRDELVRHFLVESTVSGGVRLRGCANEPEFRSLSELVQCHSQVPLSLPCRLVLPALLRAADARRRGRQRPVVPTAGNLMACEPEDAEEMAEATRRGTTYKVLYFCTVDVATKAAGGLVDDVAGAINQTATSAGGIRPIECRLRVNGSGVKLTGLGWHRDFRLAYAVQDCVVCAVDSAGRRFSEANWRRESRLFGLVVRKYGLYGNQFACLILADLEAAQPASAIAAFVNRCLDSGGWKGGVRHH